MIPKNPTVPRLTENEIRHITEIVFGPDKVPDSYDGIFVFGGTDPKRWEHTIKQYYKSPCKYIFVTGGRSRTINPHNGWIYGDSNESDIIEQKLLEAGVPGEAIIKECRSTNSLENVLCIKDEIVKLGIRSLVCVTSNNGSGRQYRTIKQQLPDITVHMSCFTKCCDSGALVKETWWQSEDSCSNVWGEYIRNYVYAMRGDIALDFTPPPTLQEHLDAYMSK